MADLEDLDRLAPDVDTDAALEEFRRRPSNRSLPRLPLLVAAAVLAVVAVVGASVLGAGDDEPVATGPADSDDSPGGESGAIVFEVLAVNVAAEEMGTLRSATTPETYHALVATAGEFDGAPPAVDFDERVVVSLTIPDDACPPELTEFERDGNLLTPVFVEPATECIEPLIPKTFVVAIHRTSVPPVFNVRLPAELTGGLGEQILEVSVDGLTTTTVAAGSAAVPPTCAVIERFADKFVDVGITYDHSASQSPEEVASTADVVLSGVLTGGFTDATGRADGLDQVGYEVEVAQLHKSPANVNLANPLTIFVSVGSVEVAEFDAAITPGVPVVVFAEWIQIDRSRPVAGIEGFVTGCPGGPLLGFTGSQGEWAEITDLDDLSARLEALSEDG